MTDINGLRLAYRGLLAGLAGGWVWLAIVLVLASAAGDVLAPLRALAAADPFGQVDSHPEAMLFGLGLVQFLGGGIGLVFAYFVARYFTVRATLLAAAPCFAFLTWLVLRDRLAATPGAAPLGVAVELSLVAASLLYGLILGASIPTRGEVARSSPTPA